MSTTPFHAVDAEIKAYYANDLQPINPQLDWTVPKSEEQLHFKSLEREIEERKAYDTAIKELNKQEEARTALSQTQRQL